MSMHVKNTRLVTGRKALLVHYERTFRRRPGRGKKDSAGSPAARLRAQGAGPQDARAALRRPFQAPVHSPLRLGLSLWAPEPV